MGNRGAWCVHEEKLAQRDAWLWPRCPDLSQPVPARPSLSHIQVHRSHLGNLINNRSRVGSEILRLHISNKFPGETDAAGRKMTLWMLRYRIPQQNKCPRSVQNPVVFACPASTVGLKRTKRTSGRWRMSSLFSLSSFLGVQLTKRRWFSKKCIKFGRSTPFLPSGKISYHYY